MGLDNYTESSDDSGGPTKTTYYQFQNPDHPESKEFDDPEKARQQFESAQYVQSKLGTDRHNLVGEFLEAVQAIDQNDDEEQLQELVDALRS